MLGSEGSAGVGFEVGLEGGGFGFGGEGDGDFNFPGFVL